MGDMSPEFATKDEEIVFWKSLAQDLKIRLAESRDELDEFQENSRELEAELEAQLEQQEARVKDLTGRLARVQTENDQIKEKLEHLQTEAHHEISDLQTGLSEVTAIKDKLSKYIRELEQENDDLERVKRTMVVSLEDFEGRLNQALERNAFLESELDEKETLREMVQRLKDESRDLRQELVIRERHEADGQEPDNERSALDSNKRLEEDSRDGAPPPAGTVPPPAGTVPPPAGTVPPLTANTTAKVSPVGGDQPATNGHVLTALDAGSMTPSSRISALNIVGDLLRKVGALESKLASCKSYVKDNPRPHTGHGQQVGRDLHRIKPRKVATKIPTQVQR